MTETPGPSADTSIPARYTLTVPQVPVPEETRPSLYRVNVLPLMLTSDAA